MGIHTKNTCPVCGYTELHMQELSLVDAWSTMPCYPRHLKEKCTNEKCNACIIYEHLEDALDRLNKVRHMRHYEKSGILERIYELTCMLNTYNDQRPDHFKK